MSAMDQRDYARDLEIAAPRKTVFAALTTLEGLAGWWTPLVSGDDGSLGQVTFGFAGLDETIVMRVDEAAEPKFVAWTCLEHSGHPEWEGTRIIFELYDDEHETSLLRFRHEGLIPRLDCYLVCESGWDRFLASIAGYVETGQGRPFS
jgi:uncharacterized protein YndB with AHSA1/START domain